MRHQRTTAGLAASDPRQLENEVVQHAVEVLDDPQRDSDLLLGGLWQLQVGELLVRVATLQAPEAPGLHGHAVVKQDGVNALALSAKLV